MKNNVAKMHIGVDVSKSHLDVCVSTTKKKMRFANSIEGIGKFQKLFPVTVVEQVTCEASGGYENALVHACFQSDYVVWVVEPRRIKSYANAMGKKAKTDKIDAEVIAQFSVQIERGYEQIKIAPGLLKLRELVKRKRDLKKIVAMEKTRLQCPRYVHTKENIERIILFLEQEIDLLNRQITKIIEENAECKKRKLILESMPGIGKETATALISDMPELGSINGKKAASLIGVAPFSKESGNSVGQAKIRDGRFAPRMALYMAALTAAYHNSVFATFYKKLKKKGKAAKVGIIAVARRMIVVLNAMIRDNTKWNEKKMLKKIDFKHSL